jgi:hypothetical protein
MVDDKAQKEKIHSFMTQTLIQKKNEKWYPKEINFANSFRVC